MLVLMTLLTAEGSAADKELDTLLTLTAAAPLEAAAAVASCGIVMRKSTCTPAAVDKCREDVHAMRLAGEVSDKVTLM
jgi:hypothetical protein